MKAIIYSEHNKNVGRNSLAGLHYTDIIGRDPAPDEVRVKLKTAGLNHRDLFLIADGTTGAPSFTLGSDGAGIIEAIGKNVTNVAVGSEVIINPCIGWERIADVPAVPTIIGGPSDGTFAESIIIPAQNALAKPSYLSWEEAGVLPLSALTAYRALFSRGELKKGDHVLIPGIGGGVATYAMLMALAAGAQVAVTSRSEAKRQTALLQGAHAAFDSCDDWAIQLKGQRVDLILDSIGPATFPRYFDVIKPGGRIVTFGASSGDSINLAMRSIFFPQISIIGTSMGSGEEFRDMLQFMGLHQIRPIIDSMYALKDTPLALERMQIGEQYGNIGINIDENNG